MLAKFMNFVKGRQTDIFWHASIILIALISFGAGWLLAAKPNNQPIIIQAPCSSETQAASSSSSVQKSVTKGKFVGSINSNVYHHPDCPWAKKITPANQIWFNSEEEAQKAGYVKCEKFDQYNK